MRAGMTNSSYKSERAQRGDSRPAASHRAPGKSSAVGTESGPKRRPTSPERTLSAQSLGPGAETAPRHGAGAFNILPVLFLVLAVAACTPKPPPVTDCRTTGCPEGSTCQLNGSTWACVPDPNAVPPIGVAASPELLLRTEGAHVVGEPVFMAVQCCTSMPAQAGTKPVLRRPMKLRVGGAEVNTRWPLASEAWQDYAHSFGANMFAFRINAWKGIPDLESEWADVGGPFLPDMTPNPAFWEKARAQANHARLNRDRVEVVWDSWYCKWAQWGEPYLYLSAEDIAACGIRPSPGVEKVWRETVRQLGCFGNVIWRSDNEGDQIQGARREWYEWWLQITNDAEQQNPCLMPDGSRVPFVHMKGTNAVLARSLPFDYLTTHARAPLLGPLDGQRWSMNDERNKAFTPDEEASNFQVARDCGQAWAFWADDMSEADYMMTFNLFKVIAHGGRVGCVLPPADDEKWVGVVDDARTPQTLAWLNEAKAAVGDPTALPGATVWDRGLLALTLVAQQVRRGGHCASGPWADAVAIQAPDGRVAHCLSRHAAAAPGKG